jgi:hypothetical protein
MQRNVQDMQGSKLKVNVIVYYLSHQELKPMGLPYRHQYCRSADDIQTLVALLEDYLSVGLPAA